jgi:hypothetical protein
VLLHPSVYPPDESLLARIVSRWHQLQKRTNQFSDKLRAAAKEVRRGRTSDVKVVRRCKSCES